MKRLNICANGNISRIRKEEKGKEKDRRERKKRKTEEKERREKVVGHIRTAQK